MKFRNVVSYSLALLALSLSPVALAKKTFQIPLKSVRLVSLVIADAGEAKESRRGHAALRFSWSNKLSDRDLVVNYGAKTPEGGTSTFADIFRGTGFLAKKFPSEVVAGYYHGFKSNYKKQSRGVSTYILDLEPHELAKIVPYINAQLMAGRARKSFQIFKYNCAVMVVEALNSGLDDPIRASGSNMPDNLPGIFRAANLVRSSTYDPVD